MKPSQSRFHPSSERGAAMLAALCLAMVFAISLASYVALCYTSLAMSTRNVGSSHSLEIAEAGVEQALYALDNNDWTGWNVSTTGGLTTATATMTMTSAGLVATSSAPTPLNLGNGVNAQVNLTVVYAAGVPAALNTLTSQGVITFPAGSMTSGLSQPTITRTLTYNPGSGGYSAAPQFVNAVASVSGRVRFTAAATLDSYNSWNSGTSSYQNYSASVKGYSAVVASRSTTSGTATVQLMNTVVDGFVMGYDYNSPASTNWLSYAGNGKVLGSNTPNGTNIDSSRIVSTEVPYQPVFPAIVPPAPNAVPSSGGNILNVTCTLGTVGATLPTVYYASGINIGSGVTVTIQGPVVIVVNGPGSGNAVATSGTGSIQISGSTASLAIFANGGSVNLGGYGIYNTNTSGPYPLAQRCAILSTTSSGYTVTISQAPPGANAFYGVIYFPNQSVIISSSGTFYGSIVGSTVMVTGSPTIHYDNALRTPDALAYDPAFAYIAAPVTVPSLIASVP